MVISCLGFFRMMAQNTKGNEAVEDIKRLLYINMACVILLILVNIYCHYAYFKQIDEYDIWEDVDCVVFDMDEVK